MKQFRMNGKKGVSPLIATVLLIAFAVALGAVVMNWGQSFTKQTIDNTETTQKTTMGCSFDVSIKEVEINGEPQICYDAATEEVEFLIRNNGNKALTGLQIQVVGDADVSLDDINETLAVGRVTKGTSDYSVAGNFSQVIITPRITVGGTDVLCSDQAIIRDSTELDEC